MDMTAGLMLAAGGALLWAGGEALVAGSAAFARRMGLPALVIGVVLMGFGTSAPELVTSIDATLTGATDLAIGNVIGSNTANVLLILGLTALIAPVAIDREVLRRDTWVMATASVFLALAAIWGPIDAMDGALFFLLLLMYLLTAFMNASPSAVWVTSEDGDAAAAPAETREMLRLGSDRESPAGAAEAALAAEMKPWPVWKGLGLAIAGLAAILAGASLFVDGAVSLSRALGISEAVIGATVVAVGTSLPELFASVVAARRGQPEMALGNVLGSNIFNIFGVLGVSAMVGTLGVSSEALMRDLPVMLAAIALLTGLVFWRDRIGRLTGGAMLAAYAAYLALMAL